MNRNRTATALKGVFAFLTLLTVGWSTSALANTGASSASPTGSTGGAPLTQQNNGTVGDIRAHWKLRNALGGVFTPTEMGGTDTIQNGTSTGPGTVTHGPGPVQMWPVQIPTATSQVPSSRDTGITKNLMTTFGWPLSDTQFQILGRMNDNIKLEEESDPERSMWNSTAQGAMQSGSAANSAAGMTTNQGQSAIQFQQKFLVNFTSEAGNRWLVIRDQLFIPIAVLLLLPGAVLCQVKAIIAQGSNVLGEVSPFEGIFRSIIAIFMIPGTLLVINYGIDVSNSVHFTIADEYSRIFGTNMYQDAQCAMWRAFPVNSQNSNTNKMTPSTSSPPPPQGNAIYSTYEALDLDVRQYDPCAGLDNSLVPDEQQNQNMILARLMTNGTNVGLTGTWNVLCAFQEAFLFYLFCMGPIAAALWVWPVKSLRGALGSWCEGVMILCFWSLFWNTVVLLMACFRGVSETGTVIMTALNFLSTIVTQYAFDFVGLVTSGASAGVQQALSGAAQNAGGGGGGGGGGKQQSGGAGASHAHKGPQSHTGATSATSKVAPMSSVATSPTAKSPTSGAPVTKSTSGSTAKPTANGDTSSTGVPPATKPFPLSTSSTAGTPKDLGAPGASVVPGKNDAAAPPLTVDAKSAADAKAAAAKNDNLASLHLNGDGSFSVNNHGQGPLSAADKQHLAEQAGQVQKAMEAHDAAALAELAGPGANMADINNLAQNGSLSSATQIAMANNGAGMAMGADGHLVSASGVPGSTTGAFTGTSSALGVVGASGLSENGLNIGNSGVGSTSMSKDGFQGTAMPIQSGVDYAGATHDQINQLAKQNGVDPSQMSMLVGQGGQAEITGPNGQALAHIQDGHMYAPGSSGSGAVMMEQNGQWVAASTGTALTPEGSGNNWQVSGTNIGFDANSGNFNVGGQSVSAADFAQNHPANVVAHTPLEHNAQAAPTGAMAGLDAAQQQSFQQLANAEQLNNVQMSANGQQVLGTDQAGHQQVMANEVGGQWVATQQPGGVPAGEVMNNQGQWVHNAQAAPTGAMAGLDSAQQQSFQQLGNAEQLSNVQMSANSQQVLGTDQAGHQQVMANEVGGQWVAAQQPGGVPAGEIMNNQGQWVHQAQAAPSGSISGFDAVQSQGIQQLAASEHLSNPQLSADGQHIVGTDMSTGQTHVMATEMGGQWAAAQHNGSADVVMNNQGQWVAPGSSTPLSAHESASGAVTWSAQGAPEVSYNPMTHTMEAGNGSVVQDNNHNWVANNQYVNTAQETPVQYNPASGSTTSYDQSQVSAQSQSYDQSQGTWSAQGAPELILNNGTFSTTYGDGSPALSISANDITPDLVQYVHQNPQQVEGLQNIAHHENLSGPVQLQAADGGVQAVANGQTFAQNDGQGWVADNNTSTPQQIIERNDGSWVSQDAAHAPAHTSDGHELTAQPEPQMPSSPPISSHPNANIAAATGFGAGAAALGAWGALKKQNSMNNPPAAPKAEKPNAPSEPDATAQNKSLTPQESQARHESEKKKREALAQLLKEAEERRQKGQ